MRKLRSKTSNRSVTENGAIGYASTGSALLDLELRCTTMRDITETDAIRIGHAAYKENPRLFAKWVMRLQDPRGGHGERKAGRAFFNALICWNPEMAGKILPLLAEYGRYDSIVFLAANSMNDNIREKALDVIIRTLSSDMEKIKTAEANGTDLKNVNTTLLAKWLPSINAGRNSRILANKIRVEMGLDAASYRKMVSYVRKPLDLIETHLAQKTLSEKSYESVPSRANKKYQKAFKRTDGERYSDYLSKVNRGETTMHAATLYPYEVLMEYGYRDLFLAWSESRYGYYRTPFEFDVKALYNPTAEAMWKSLPNTVPAGTNMLILRDGSGSMTSTIPGLEKTVSCADVATALTLYFAQRQTGEWHNKFITYSDDPKMVDLSDCNTLIEAIVKLIPMDDWNGTDIEACFDIILDTAVRCNMPPEEMIDTVLTISDMEFNCARAFTGGTPDKTLFEHISQKFEARGYKMPKLVFWSVNSRTNTIPMVQNDAGVILVSGFDTNTINMVLSNQTDPYLALVETLNSPRYAAIDKALDAE